MAPKLCLNMIVKNEAARIVRCLASVADFIDTWAIVDTGSSDGTPGLIEDFFARREIPGRMSKAPFINFSQARNQALQQATSLDWDYLLLLDADMELVVIDDDWKEWLTDPAYHVRQNGGTMTYWNTRLVHRNAGAQYYGVTHEYLSVEGAQNLDKIWFRDHADGANRVNKVERDIDLLRDGLRVEPQNARYWFYLAQSYREFDPRQAAIAAYKKRIELGGWDEEVFYAKWQLARLLKDTGKDDEFAAISLSAYNTRPTRAEPLYDLAKYHREKGNSALSCMFAEMGLSVPYPKDGLFVDDYIYNFGLKEEFSISGFYSEAKREKAFDVCNDLALSAEAPWNVRDLARSNLFHYLKPLHDTAKSFEAKQISFTDDDPNYTSTNPSVTMFKGQIIVNVRTVNYKIDEQGFYHYPDGDTAIRTHNWLVRYDDGLCRGPALLVKEPDPFPVAYDQVLGFEDMRVFEVAGHLGFNATVRQLNKEGWCEQVVGGMDADGKITYWNVVEQKVGSKQHEKNWMPFVFQDHVAFMYRPNVVIDAQGGVVQQHDVDHALDTFSGSSQVVPFHEGYLGVVHEARIKPGHTKRFYQHRFVWWDAGMMLRRISMPFFFNEKGIEFCAGLCWHPDGKRLLLSYGVDDRAAWLGHVSQDDVRHMLWS